MKSHHLLPDGSVRKEFGDLLARLADDLGASITEQRIRDYAVALGDVPWPVLRRACGRALRESQFFPRPRELRSLAGFPAVEDDAVLAWSAFRAAAASAGAYTTVEIDDGAAAEALTLVFGSWPQFCAMDDGPALTQHRQEFMVAYRVARTRPQVARQLPGLLPPPPPEKAAHTWVARITAGTVQHERAHPQLEGHVPERRALLEAEGAEGSAGSGDHPEGPGAVRDA